MVSFLHTADLHLGMRITRFDPAIVGKVREARFTALDNIRKEAKQRKVDFLIVAGDLFDDAAVDGLTARRAFEMLDDLPMPVYVLPGNHDPLLAGGIWDRPPWNQQTGRSVRLLKEAIPVEAGPGLLLFPCPVLRKTCMSDPTAWIAGHSRELGAIRIGVAHGSLRIRDDLPPDDHLISRHAASELQLDYLALGHWHGRKVYSDPEEVERTAYSGVHEPMSFQGSADGQTGWVPYGGAGRQEFADSGRGEVLHVTIRSAGEPPRIEPVEVGHYYWNDEKHELRAGADLERLIQDVATRPDLERRLLRLSVSGVLDAQNMLRLDELREILSNRYLLGQLDETGLHVQPTEDEMREIAGQGVLQRILETLQTQATAVEPASRQVAERAILLLYQIAREVRA